MDTTTRRRTIGQQQQRVDPVVSMRMSRVRGRDTRPELAVRSELHRRGLRYRVNKRPLPALRRTADIVFGPARIAVMIDGCYWHGCPDHYRPSTKNAGFWREKLKDNQRRDAETNDALREAGWQVLRFWEHEDPLEIAEHVHQAVRTAREADSPAAHSG